MTDAEIKKALECSQYYDCVDCPHYQEDCVDVIKDKCELSKFALDLINRQQAEIERLQNKVEELADVLSNSIRIRYAEAKAEAIKEFAESVISYCEEVIMFNDYEEEKNLTNYIVNLLKERVGDAE
jgi:hypothetical protein